MKKLLQIETKRLVLKDFAPGDWKTIHDYSSDPKVVRFVPFGPNSLAQAKAYHRLLLRVRREKPREDFCFLIFSKTEGLPVGGCRLNSKGSVHKDASLGYVLIRRHWGKGYATEAAKALIHFGFSKLKLHRIWATCDTRNKASARVLEKAGMKREGLLHRNVFQKGKWRDSYLFAIIKKE